MRGCLPLARGGEVAPVSRHVKRSFLDVEGAFMLCCFRAAFSVPSRFTFFKVETLQTKYLFFRCSGGRLPRGKRQRFRDVAFSRKKRVGGRMGGPGGKETPLCASRDRRRPQAVPVATKEATGIDSRDKGVSFPPVDSRDKGVSFPPEEQLRTRSSRPDRGLPSVPRCSSAVPLPRRG